MKVTEAGVIAARQFVEQGVPVDSAYIASTIRSKAQEVGVSILPKIGGHCIGHTMHEFPHFIYVSPHNWGIEHYIITPGTSFCIEPVIIEGIKADNPKVYIQKDGWTGSTKRRLTAQFETQVLVTEDGLEIITQ